MAPSSPRVVRAAAAALALLSAAGAASAQPGAATPTQQQQQQQQQQRGEQRTVEGLLARRSDGSYAPARYDPGTAPPGLRSNNWVGIKGPNLQGRWPGQTGASEHGFARFDDPAHSVRAFVELVRQLQERHNARSAADILRRYSPPGDCSGAPSVPPGGRREGGGCPENETTPPVTAVRVARAAGLQPTDDLGLFGAGGQVDHPDRLRALLDAVVTPELGPGACPQPPRGESWIGCRVDDAVFNRAVETLGRRG